MKSNKQLENRLVYVQDTSLHKYEYFDEILNSGKISNFLGLDYNNFVSDLNKENEYNIFHYILLLNNNNEIKEKQFTSLISTIKNINFVKILLKRKDVVGNIPLHYIINQGNQPLVLLYNKIFKLEFSSCLNTKNLQDNSPLDILKNDKQCVNKFLNNQNNCMVLYKIYKKINFNNKIAEKFISNVILLPEIHTKNFYSMVDIKFQQFRNTGEKYDYKIIKQKFNSQENITEPDLSDFKVEFS